MNIKKLKEIIKDIPDNTKIVIPGSDHSYHEADAIIDTVLYDKCEQIYTEDYGKENTSEEDCGKRIKVLIVKR